MALTHSPFPGMDPYLETHWLDVDTALIAESRRSLNRSLPDGLVARAEERIAIDPVKERSVRIENQDGQLITVIEFISPGNKRMPGLKAYHAKRIELLNAGVHVVEIDLVRSGNWQALFKPHSCMTKAIALYRVTVRTAEIPAPAYVYPINLQDALPEIQIPLRAKDPKVTLALQPMIETIYADGRYGRTLDYTRQLDPPLSELDQHFAAERISAGG
jgi:hypothetical protein